ncbi:BA3454 family stress response protein [Niallia oryzisoli]|uniref:BA3454 family stress response protein n=1 Tax=Niallia oryzisoli TaxID=1737571 RepID=A0ABZ2CJX7_9BACI
MIEVMVNVEYKGRNYRTNVIAYKGTPEDEILRLAKKQVIEQWT